MKEKKVLFLLVVLLALLVGIFFFQEIDKKNLKTSVAISPNAQSTLSFSPSSKSVSAGESFSLEAKINPSGGNQISGASLVIKFPVDGIECETITGGTGLTVFTQGAINNTNGTASIEVGASPTSPITASTTIAILNCEGRTSGNHSISFDETASSAYAIGETGSVIKSTSPASISVSGSTTTPTMTSVTFSPTSISAGQTSLLSWAVSDADGVYATCKGSNGTTVTGIDNLQVPTSTMTSFKTSPYEELIAYGNKITCTLYAYKGNTKSTSSKEAELTLTSASITTPAITSVSFSPTSISKTGETSVLSWSVSDADGIYATCKGSTGTVLPGIDSLKIPASQMTSYTTAKYEELTPYGTSIVCTFYAYQEKGTGDADDVKSAASTATLTLVSAGTIVNGTCGSSNGQSYSSAPSSGLCTLGTASAVSGSGPWTWTCSGSGGGTSINCSANLASSSTTYTYSPTTSVIPVTEYTYSYTSKVAPASGPVTNVVLLLSISAAVTLGVWVVMKKIKG